MKIFILCCITDLKYTIIIIIIIMHFRDVVEMVRPYNSWMYLSDSHSDMSFATHSDDANFRLAPTGWYVLIIILPNQLGGFFYFKKLLPNFMSALELYQL
jgi:hypothetical protein